MLSGVVEEFGLQKDVLRSLLGRVEQHYNDAPYHNFNHVVHVLHACWMVRVAHGCADNFCALV